MSRRGGTKKRRTGSPAGEAKPARSTGRVVRALAWPAAIAVAALGAFLLAKQQAQRGSDQVAPPARGLPHTPDYHTVAVDPANAERLVLGTHAGLYTSRDGGVTWQLGPLGRKDVIELERGPDGTLWAAGHFVLERSSDGGRTWESVRTDGLPDLDLHGFAVDDDGTVYAAVHGEGLYVSTNGGADFERLSSDVGGNVYGLVVEGERVLVADPQRGVLRSDDGGRTWRVVLAEPVVGLAANPEDPDVVLASGGNLRITRDGGSSWREVFAPGPAVGPAAWASGMVGYAIVAETRTVYRTGDGGARWSEVG